MQKKGTSIGIKGLLKQQWYHLEGREASSRKDGRGGKKGTGKKKRKMSGLARNISM